MWVVAVEGPSERRQRCRGTGREAAECLCERSYLKSRHLTLNPERADKCWAVRAWDRDPCAGEALGRAGLGLPLLASPPAGADSSCLGSVARLQILASCRAVLREREIYQGFGCCVYTLSVSS